MSQWHIGDGFGSASPQSREILQSWSNQEQEQSRASAEAWGPQQAQPRASSFHYVPDNSLLYSRVAHGLNEAPLAARFEPNQHEAPLSTRIDMHGDQQAEHRYMRPDGAQEVKESTPLSRIYDILDVHSQSSKWLEQRGYLEAFKSPNCTLDLTFGTDERGSKIGAVVTAPDGTKRTVVSCEGGTSFQRLTAANGQELVKFLSSGQIVELNPFGRSA